jgi:hypothetical protein
VSRPRPGHDLAQHSGHAPLVPLGRVGPRGRAPAHLGTAIVVERLVSEVDVPDPERQQPARVLARRRRHRLVEPRGGRVPFRPVGPEGGRDRPDLQRHEHRIAGVGDLQIADSAPPGPSRDERHQRDEQPGRPDPTGSNDVASTTHAAASTIRHARPSVRRRRRRARRE